MSLKAFIPSGQTALTVNGLHQWDYGQKLEIHDDGLPALVEVHFACAGMTEAVVRSCSVVQGVAEVVIPDQCLEQTTPIVAWVYEVGESSGATIKTITLTVAQRARPQPGGTVPTVLSDKYTELVAAINEQVAALTEGNVTVASALVAGEADHADEADHAGEADALLSGDALSAAGTLDDLVTPGRYYCDYSVGTPTGGYGYVDVFVRHTNIMQAFYSWSTGDIYLRKKSGDEGWTEWQKGNAEADEARRASYAGILVPDNLPGTESSSESAQLTITAPGIYVIDILSDSESDNHYTAVIIIPDIQQAAYSTIAKSYEEKVTCQIIYYPQGRSEDGTYYWGVLQVEHDADYAYEYQISRCVRIANLY